MKSKAKMERARTMLADYFDLMCCVYDDARAARYGASIARGYARADRFDVRVNDPTYRRTVRRLARGKYPSFRQFRKSADAIYRAGQADAERFRRSAVRADAP